VGERESTLEFVDLDDVVREGVRQLRYRLLARVAQCDEVRRRRIGRHGPRFYSALVARPGAARLRETVAAEGYFASFDSVSAPKFVQ
jgi:hypothetical protein